MATPTALRVVEKEWVAWRRLWKASVFQATISPLLFLAAMGLGLGDLVNKGSGGVDGVDYLVFVAPGLMAASAMMQAAGESLWPVLGGVKWLRTYHAAVSTPVSAGALFAGHVMWTCLRVLFSSTVFLIVAAILGGVPSGWGVLAIPAAVLGASVFAAALNGYAVTQESDIPFAVIMRIGLSHSSCSRARSSPSAVCPTGWSRWRGSRRCGTRWSCAAPRPRVRPRRPARWSVTSPSWWSVSPPAAGGACAASRRR